MKKLILLFVCLSLVVFGFHSSAIAATKIYGATSLIGGGAGALDAIDGASLADLDAALVFTVDTVYIYSLDDDAGGAEGSPAKIAPDANAGNKRWVLIFSCDQALLSTSSPTFADLSLTNLTVSTIATLANAGLHLLDTNASHDLILSPGSDLTADKTLTLITGDANRSITLGGNATFEGNAMLPVRGQLSRSQFAWKDADEIYLNSGVYHHSGTTNQTVYWASQLTFQVGSAGSNALSDDLGASEWHYIYLDDSAIVTAGTNLLTASELLNDTTAPTWSHTKNGLYNGNDRCIFAVYSNGASQLDDFDHDGDLVLYEIYESNLALTDIDDEWTDVTLTIPAIANRAQVTFQVMYIDGGSYAYWRTNGADSNPGHLYGRGDVGVTLDTNTTPVYTDSSSKIEIRHDTSNGNKSAVFTDGWFLPIGM